MITFLAEGLLDVFFQQIDRFFDGQDIGELEKAGLHNHVDPAAKSDVLCYFYRIDSQKLEFLIINSFSHVTGELIFHLINRPRTVEQKGSPVFNAFKNIIDIDIGRVMTGDKISLVDQIGRLDRHVTEAKMRYGDTTRFFGIISEIALGILFGVVTDDFDGTLVGADSSV